MPASWSNFISLGENKRRLIRFLTSEIIKQEDKLPHEYKVVAGESESPEIAESSPSGLLQHLNCSHEEADMHIVFHAVDAASQGVKRVIVRSRDIDVLVLLTYHRIADEVWIEAGTKNKPGNIPVVHEVRKSLSKNVIHHLLSFHDLTRCNSTCQFCGQCKNSSWLVYIADPGLLDSFTADTAPDFAGAECFVVKMYSASSALTCLNDLRAELFHRINDPEKLPPTHDALMLQFKRCKHQVMIWSNSTVPKPAL